MLKVRYRTNEEIWEAADGFREGEPLIGYTDLPIDTVAISEIVLRLDPIPFPDLFLKYHIDAALTLDMSGIYIDESAYRAIERPARWRENRLRFSIAHEIGHYVLHGEEIERGCFASLEEYIQWMGKRSNPSSPEYQADEFAGRFLIPRDSLLRYYDRSLEEAAKRNPEWKSDPRLRQALARKLAPKFGVNYQVIETRFDRERIWPVE